MKSKQQGNTTMIALGAVLAVIILLGLICTFSYISAYNYGNRMDNQLVAIQDNNKNIYAQGTQKVMEIAQVPVMFKDDLKQLLEADIQGRYGKSGSQATFQFLKEHEIKLEPAIYMKVQQTVESFRNEFQNNQTKMIDVKRSYMTGQGAFWQGTWLRLAGYPKVNMADFKSVTTSKTEQVFGAGKETEPLQLRK